MLTFKLGSGEEGEKKENHSRVIGHWSEPKVGLNFIFLLNEIQTTSIRKMIVHLFDKKTIFNKIETI